MEMQNVTDLTIPEGAVRTIQDSTNRLIWGRLNYDTKYAGDTVQDGTPTPATPQAVQTVTGAQTVTIGDGVSSQSYEINLGKNLFDKNNYTYLDGYFENRGEIIVTTAGRNVVVYLPCKPSTTYAFSSQEDTGLNSRTISTTAQLPANGVQTSQLGATVGLGERTHTTASDASYIVIRFQSLIGTTFADIANAVFANFQIEVGSTATPYTPYFTPIELCKLGDYQDYIYKSGDDWYVHKNCREALFNGAENWDMLTSSVVFRTRINDMLGQDDQDGIAPLLSNYFPAVSYHSLTMPPYVDYGIAGRATVSSGIGIRNINCANLDAFKTWLSTNNLNVYYVMATPTNTKITNNTLIAQLNTIHEWLTRYGYTSIVSGNLPLIINQINL